MHSNFETCYVSCGCNKCPHAADWGRNGLICYAVSNSVAIYDPTYGNNSGKVLYTLHGHTERVNSVRWLRNSSNTPENEFLSASADGTVLLWCWDDKSKSYVEETILKGHTNIVNIADGLVRYTNTKNYVLNETPLVIATSSIDSTVGIWKRNETEELKLIHIIDWDSGFCLDVKLSVLPDSGIVLLACATHDNNIYLFTEKILSELDETKDDQAFENVHILTGHDDWIRALDITIDAQNDIYLASASQDSFVRIYKISQHHGQQTKLKRIQNLDMGEDLETEVKIFTIYVNQTPYHYAVTLETILAGHEGWVYGVSWYNPHLKKLHEVEPFEQAQSCCDFKDHKIKLLSSSMDKSLIIWSQDGKGAWIEEARLGEVGGNILGFYGGKFRSDGKAVFGHGYQGSFHMWGYDETSNMWIPQTVVGGHTSEVMDLAWDVKGNYILSVGSDQTTRLHAPWRRNDTKQVTWHELARPQIHGYDLTAVAVLNEHKFATGAEEKVIRAFTAPHNFIENFRRLSQYDYAVNSKSDEHVPQGASVPALGLSNKPVFEQMRKEGFIVGDEYPDLYFSPIKLTKPPTEETLLQNTLWPEAQKLYGHGFEIYSLAARSDGSVLASSCKASSPEHAAIILWNAKTWLLLQKLISHQLTVTQLAFSPDGQYLLSVSRDRRWSLFIVQSNGKNYDLLCTSRQESLHTRVIWSCAWTFDSTTFATGSRDGKIGFWSDIKPSKSDIIENVQMSASLDLGKESVTALAFAPVLRRKFHILAAGLEKGTINLYSYCNGNAQNLWVLFKGSEGHQQMIKRLAFRPKIGRAGFNPEDELDDTDIIQLASCGTDHVLKVYNVFLHLL